MIHNSITYKRIKQAMWILLLMICLIPLFQMLYPVLEVKELDGAVKKEKKAEFNWSAWFDESYQQQTETYLNQNFGFRPNLLRFHNQLDFTLFNKLHAKGVIVGKENYFYEENYLKAYKGLDFIGEDIIQKRVFKLRQIQDTLDALGKKIVVVMAIGKGSYLPEYFPSEWDTITQRQTNYHAYVNAFKIQDLRYLDFQKWFLEIKDTTPFPLYGKCGIHWSEYGEYIAADSLIKYSIDLLKRPIAQLKLHEIEVNKYNSEKDYDIGKGLNLITDRINTFPMAYPKFHIEKLEDEQAPTALFVADSYYWGMFNWGMSRDVFGDGEFWFYNQSIYPDSYEKDITVAEINLQEKVEENDIIFLLSTDANLYKFAFGFIEDLHKVYFPAK